MERRVDVDVENSIALEMSDVLSEKCVRSLHTLPGTHDFSAFGSPTTPKGTTVRTVMKAEWLRHEKDEWRFEVQADAFLYRMVRRLVFVQVAAAQGKVSAEGIARSLAKQASAESVLPSGLAPAHGLTLVEVMYPAESMGQ